MRVGGRVVRRALGSLRVIVTASCVASVLVSPAARADERSECASAYTQTQRHQQKDETLRAFEEARRCARDTCPALLVAECKEWASELREKVSKLEVSARGIDGCAAVDHAVQVDRVTRTEGDIFVAPGIHEIRVVDTKGRILDETIDVAPGETRKLSFDFAPPGATCSSGPTPWDKPPIPTPTKVLVLSGGALLLTGVTLGLIGVAKRGSLDDCRPGCSSDQIAGVENFFVAGDIVGAVGLVAAAAGALVYLVARGDLKPASPPKSASVSSPPGPSRSSPTFVLGRGLGLSF